MGTRRYEDIISEAEEAQKRGRERRTFPITLDSDVYEWIKVQLHNPEMLRAIYLAEYPATMAGCLEMLTHDLIRDYMKMLRDGD